MRRPAASVRPTSSSSSWARARAAEPLMPYRPHCSSSSSRPVCSGSRPISCRATPMCRRTSAGCASTSMPATRALPAVAGSRVQSTRTVVVLPAPFGPRKPNTSPAATLRSMPLTASTPPLNVRRRQRVSIAGGQLGSGPRVRTWSGAWLGRGTLAGMRPLILGSRRMCSPELGPSVGAEPRPASARARCESSSRESSRHRGS